MKNHRHIFVSVALSIFQRPAPSASHKRAPLPELIQLSFSHGPGQELRFLAFDAQGDGSLPDGGPGWIEVAQVGLSMTAGKGVTADGVPVERITIRPRNR